MYHLSHINLFICFACCQSCYSTTTCPSLHHLLLESIPPFLLPICVPHLIHRDVRKRLVTTSYLISYPFPGVTQSELREFQVSMAKQEDVTGVLANASPAIANMIDPNGVSDTWWISVMLSSIFSLMFFRVSCFFPFSRRVEPWLLARPCSTNQWFHSQFHRRKSTSNVFLIRPSRKQMQLIFPQKSRPMKARHLFAMHLQSAMFSARLIDPSHGKS